MSLWLGLKWFSYVWAIESLQGKIVNHVSMQFVFCNWLPHNSFFCSFSLGIPARNWQQEHPCPVVFLHHEPYQWYWVNITFFLYLSRPPQQRRKTYWQCNYFTFKDVFAPSITISGHRKGSISLWIINIIRKFYHRCLHLLIACSLSKEARHSNKINSI